MIQIHNEGNFIKVFDDNTGITSFISKTNIIIQQDTSDTFFLKNDSFIKYYKFSEITFPLLQNINELISTIVSFSTNESTTNNTSVETILNNLNILMDVNTKYDSNSFQIDEIIENGASSATDVSTSGVDMTIAESAGSRVVRQTKEYINLLSTNSVVGLVSGSLIDNITTTHVQSKIGLFDDASDASNTTLKNGFGVFFQHTSSTSDTAVVLRNNGVDTVVPQTDWNIDVANGNGASGAIFVPSDVNTFVFSIGTIYGMDIKVGFYHNGHTVMVHEFTLPISYNHASKIPIRWEISSHNGLIPSAVAKMVQRKAIVYASDTIDDSKHFSKMNSSTKIVSGENTSVPICSLRLASAYARSKINIKNVHILNTSPGGIGQWELVLNTTSTGATYESVNQYSIAEYSSTETTVQNDGVVVASGYISDISDKQIDLGDTNPLYANIDGTVDTITLKITNLHGTLNIFAGVTWEETV